MTQWIYHSHYWDGGLVGSMLKNDFGIPLIHTSHSLGAVKQATAEDPTAQDMKYDQRIDDEKSIFKSATAIIAESTQEKNDLQKIYKVPNKKINIIPAGVDIKIKAVVIIVLRIDDFVVFLQ